MKITLPILNEFISKNNITETDFPDVLNEVNYLEGFHSKGISDDLVQVMTLFHYLSFMSCYFNYQLKCKVIECNRTNMRGEKSNDDCISISSLPSDLLWNYDKVHEEYQDECPFDLGMILFDVYGDGHEIIYLAEDGSIRSYNYENDESEEDTTLIALNQSDFINRLEVIYEGF